MAEFSIYDMATGRVLLRGSSSVADGSANADGASRGHYPQIVDPETHYFAGGVLTARQAPDFSPLSGLSEGDTATLVGLQPGAVVSFTPPNGSGASETVGANGEMDLTFSDPGDFEISVSEVFPALPGSTVVTVAAALVSVEVEVS